MSRFSSPRAAFFALAAFALSAYAQVDTGTILGTVKDASGGVVPNATITLVNESTGIGQTGASSSGGQYTFTPLRIGKYSITAQAPGFQSQKKTGLQLDIQQQAVVDFSLSPGQVSSTVEVTAEVPTLQSEKCLSGAGCRKP